MISHLIAAKYTKLSELLTQVLCVLNIVKVASFNVIKEDVAIGRDTIFQAGLTATSKGNKL
jgi:hypothetical protein